MKTFYFNKPGLSSVAHDAKKVEKVHLWAQVRATSKGVKENGREGFVTAENYREACKMYIEHNSGGFNKEYTYEAVFNPVTNKYDVVLTDIGETLYSEGVYCENPSAKMLTGYANAESALQAVKMIEEYIAKKK